MTPRFHPGSIPYDNTTHQYSRCQRYDYNITQYLEEAEASVDPPPGAPVVQCDHGWVFDQDEHSTSVVSDVSIIQCTLTPACWWTLASHSW